MTRLDEKLVKVIEDIAKTMYGWGIDEDPIDRLPNQNIANWARRRLTERGYELPSQEKNNDPT